MGIRIHVHVWGGRPYCRTILLGDDDGKDAMLAMVAMVAGIKIYSGKSQQPRRSPLMHVHLLLTHKHMLKVDEGKKKWLGVWMNWGKGNHGGALVRQETWFRGGGGLLSTKSLLSLSSPHVYMPRNYKEITLLKFGNKTWSRALHTTRLSISISFSFRKR